MALGKKALRRALQTPKLSKRARAAAPLLESINKSAVRGVAALQTPQLSAGARAAAPRVGNLNRPAVDVAGRVAADARAFPNKPKPPLLPGMARNNGRIPVFPAKKGSGVMNVDPFASPGRKGRETAGWVRRNPGKTMALGMLGATTAMSAGSLMRNQGPGVTGNGYRPVGSSSGGF